MDWLFHDSVGCNEEDDVFGLLIYSSVIQRRVLASNWVLHKRRGIYE